MAENLTKSNLTAIPSISQENNKRIAKNTLMLYFRMILTMAVSLYTSRVILNVLGVEDYGTYNVVGGVVTMFGFFNSAMVSATQRFLSFELGRKDFALLRRTFNVSVVIHAAIALLIFLLAETIGLWFVNHYLNIPEARMEAARWVYHFSVLAFMVTIIQVPYNAIIIAHERMNVYAYVSILEVLLKLAIVFLLTIIAFDKLKLYGILVFIVALIIAILYRTYGLRNFSETRFQFVKDRALYKTLISYSGWNLFGNFAGVAKGQGVNIILNIFFGTVVNAAQGVAHQINAAVYSFVSNFQIASNPQIIKSYAAENKQSMISLVIRTSKFSFYMLFILTLPVMLEIDYILELWLKIVPDYTAIFTMLILVNALIDSVSGPLMTSLQATGKIKVYQSVVGLLLFLVLPTSYFFLRKGFPPESTFFVSIVIAIIAFIFRVILAKKQIPEFSRKTFLKEVIVRNIPVIIVAIIPWLVKENMQPGLVRLIVVTLTSVIISFVAIYLIGMNRNERKFAEENLNILLSKIKR